MYATANMNDGTGRLMPQGHPESQGLLPQGGSSYSPNRDNRSAIPPGMAGMAAGGVKVEDALGKFGISWQVMFFVSSLGVMFGAVVGALGAFGTFEPAALVDEVFLFFFGMMVFVMDIPGHPRWTLKYRQWIRKYMRVLTRISGTSIWCLFLGCMTVCSLWPSSNKISTKDLLLFIAIVISFVVVASSILGFLISIAKSMRLRDVQRAIQTVSKGNFQETYRKYAMASPHIGMRMDEFNRMCADHTQGRVQYPLSDLAVIYNALEDEQKDALSEKEFVGWMAGGISLL
eukprot:TRINITY_DN599_c0_g1_i1.p1 TRINITY_DN599_c0_g1~~TRINITY_DN599_c0_g1_i1.p1  ORF type:complete len:288 (-),score=22.83 TRINITY_DN599_c0_g1_i1:238-1101(-)